MSEPTCEDDQRFHLMFAKNGCLACQCEKQAAEIKQLKYLIRRLLEKMPWPGSPHGDVAWCAGCGAIEYCDPDKDDSPHKPDCVLVAARKVISSSEWGVK